MVSRDAFVGLVNGTTVTLALLVNELDRRGAVSKKDFAALLRGTAEELRPGVQDAQPQQRLDAAIFRNIADLLDHPKREWTPVVIEGGVTDEPDKR